MKKTFLLGLLGILSLLVVVSPAFALNITVSVDKTRVFMGDNITMSGKIMFDNGTTTEFQYRAAVVAPRRIIVCDSNKTSTASDGTFTLNCMIPTAADAEKLGIPASLTRAAIPYVAGVAVKNPDTNSTVKKYAKLIIAINQEKYGKELDNIIFSLNNFINQSSRFIPECDKIEETAAKYNVTNITTECIEIQEKINELIANATALSNQAQQLKANITAINIEDFRDSFKALQDSLKDLRSEVNNIKKDINSVKWDTLKEIRKNITDIRQDIKNERFRISELRNASRGIRR
jgi:archaellum component FlaC